MNFFRFFSFFFIACIFWSSNYVAGELYNALFYNQTDNKLVEMSKSNGSETCSSCISACPANSDSTEEQIINQFASVTQNGLFLRGIYNNAESTRDIETRICKQPPIPAIVWEKSLEVFGIGYEFYAEERKTELKCSDDHLNFKPVIGGIAKETQEQLPANILIKSCREENEKKTCTKFQLLDQELPNRNFEFFWIQVFTMMVISDGRHRQIVFTKDTINDYFLGKETTFRCENYFTGYKDQTIPFENIESDTSTANQTNDEITLAEPPVENHLEKTQIIPAHMFHTLSSRLATCMYINTAYIWSSIAKDRLKNVDLFLYAMYRLWPSEINISFGVDTKSEEANLIDHEDNWLFRLYPIPEVIFRVVEYKFQNQIYDAVVVIHNNLNSDIPADERICTTPVEGWPNIVENAADLKAPGLIYTCMLTKDVYEKLGVDRDPILENVKALELNNFPKLDLGKMEIVYEDVLEEIHDQLKYIKGT